MALTYSTFTCFKEVEAYYNNITPLRGENNRGKDIRPIGDRRRKHERIVKISPNCYALSDGFHFGDPYFGSWYYGAENFIPTPKDMERYAPIVWRKKRDGTEEVTLRNGWGPHQHTGRYQFLYRHTPKGMWFRNRNGKHFIQINGTGYHPRADSTEYYLAKTRTTPEPVYRAIMNNTSSHYFQKRMRDWEMLRDDNSALTFKNTDDGWQLVTGGKPVPTPPRKVINKTAKAKYKKHIDAFKEWAFTMGPLLPIADYGYAQEQNKVVQEWMKENDSNIKHYWGWGNPLSQMDVTTRRQIISFESHPLRLPMAVFMLREIEFHRAENEDDIRLIKQRTNTWINNTMGFVKTVHGEKQ